MWDVMTHPIPSELFATRTRLRELAEQLACEYAGAVAPGRVMRLVATTATRLRRTGLTGDLLLQVTKTAARAALTALVADSLSGRTVASRASTAASALVAY